MQSNVEQNKINKIIETLRNISVENHGDIYLETKHYSSKILIELEKICKLNLNKENINYVEFKKIIKKLIWCFFNNNFKKRIPAYLSWNSFFHSIKC